MDILGEHEEEERKIIIPNSNLNFISYNTHITFITPRSVPTETPRSTNSHRGLNDILMNVNNNPNNQINDVRSNNDNENEQRQGRGQGQGQRQREGQEQNLEGTVNLEKCFESFMPILKKMQIFCCLNAICVLLIIFTIILVIQTSNISFPYMKAFQSKFYKTKFINDLYIISEFEICDTPYEKSILGFWPGYNQSCYCGNGSNSHVGICNPNEISECQDIGPFNKVPVNKWLDAIFCIRRSMKDLIEYFDYSIQNEKIGCNDPNKKLCTISSIGNFICVDHFEFCPLTQILILNNTETQITDWSIKQNMKNSKVLYGKSGNNKATAILNLTVQYLNCTRKNYFEPSLDIITQNSCLSPTEIKEIDVKDEYNIASENSNETMPSSLKLISSPMGLYSKKADFLDYCVFDQNMNPKTIDNILNVWINIRHCLLYNMIAILALIFLNFLRTIIIIYINLQNYEVLSIRKYIRRVLSFTRILIKHSYVFIVYEILASIFIFSWSVNILKFNKLRLLNWNYKNCQGTEIFLDVSLMIEKLSAIDNLNLIIIANFAFLAISEFLLRKTVIYRELSDSGQNSQRS